MRILTCFAAGGWGVVLSSCGTADAPTTCGVAESSTSALVDVAPRLEAWVQQLRSELDDSCRASVQLLRGDPVFPAGGNPSVEQIAATCQQVLDLLGLTRFPEADRLCSVDFAVHSECEAKSCGLSAECIGGDDRCAAAGPTDCAVISPPACAVDRCCEAACSVAGRIGSSCEQPRVTPSAMNGVDVAQLGDELARWRALDANLLRASQSGSRVARGLASVRALDACDSSELAAAERSARGAADTSAALVFARGEASLLPETPLTCQ